MLVTCSLGSETAADIFQLRELDFGIGNLAPDARILDKTPFIEIDGRKSEPRDVTTMISRLAQLRNLPVEEMKRIVTANAERVLAFAGVSIPVFDR